jgi:hypothetical protein
MSKSGKNESDKFGIRPIEEGLKPDSSRGVKPTQGQNNPKPPRGGTGQSNKTK